MLRPQLVRNQQALLASSLERAWAKHYVGMARSYSSGVQPSFSYHLATSSSGKKSKLGPAEQGVTFWTQKHLQQDQPIFASKEAYAGQDAFFMAHIAKSARHVMFGVADGVGGWEDMGVNPAVFSHGLCRYMADATLRPEQAQDLRPVKILTKGHDQLQADKKIPAGGSTASIAAAEADGQMEVANLGDSGFAILSPGKVTYKSEAQTSGFNTPWQLSKYTPEMKKRMAIFGGEPVQHTPAMADTTRHQLTHGDVVILGTDGLWDNLSVMDVLEIVSPMMADQGYWVIEGAESTVNKDKLREVLSQEGEQNMAGRLAYAITKKAKEASHDMKRDGPFAREVRRHFPGEDWRGGKVDDIAVIACIAVQDADKISAKL